MFLSNRLCIKITLTSISDVLAIYSFGDFVGQYIV